MSLMTQCAISCIGVGRFSVKRLSYQGIFTRRTKLADGTKEVCYYSDTLKERVHRLRIDSSTNVIRFVTQMELFNPDFIDIAI